MLNCNEMHRIKIYCMKCLTGTYVVNDIISRKFNQENWKERDSRECNSIVMK